MGFPLVSLSLACACLLTLAQAESPCYQKSHGDFVPDPTDCRKFYVCDVFGEGVPFSCGEGQAWHPSNRVCVLRDSAEDLCKDSTVPDPQTFISETCKPGMTNKLPHPTHCARYYDCAQTGVVRGLDEEGVRECPHPKLFNSKTGDCEEHHKVECGEKIAPRDACEYEMNKCQRSHCIPCFVRFPSCVGLGDGKQAWRGREQSPYYAECEDERVVKHGRCPNGQLFHPQLLVCADAQSVIES